MTWRRAPLQHFRCSLGSMPHAKTYHCTRPLSTAIAQYAFERSRKEWYVMQSTAWCLRRAEERNAELMSHHSFCIDVFVDHPLHSSDGCLSPPSATISVPRPALCLSIKMSGFTPEHQLLRTRQESRHESYASSSTQADQPQRITGPHAGNQPRQIHLLRRA